MLRNCLNNQKLVNNEMKSRWTYCDYNQEKVQSLRRDCISALEDTSPEKTPSCLEDTLRGFPPRMAALRPMAIRPD
jgi:hypothetical protein